jgi:ATP adenylyltransferase
MANPVPRDETRAMADQLWAPWRLAYIAKDPSTKPDTECFICRGLAGSDDRANQIVLRTPRSVVLLNRYPYNNGHLLIAPLNHVGRLDELSNDELLEVNQSVRRMIAIVERRMRPDGFNIGVNMGKVAGAGLPGHIHWHLVPRWNGDTNFMPVVADVKVISQSLEALYEVLAADLAEQR